MSLKLLSNLITNRPVFAIDRSLNGKPGYQIMKLYFSPGACSFAPHIVLHEAEIEHEAIYVAQHPTEFKLGQLKDGTDFYTINPLGYVPVLELDDGTRLTEGPAIVQYIADQAPEKNLAPPAGSIQRAQMQSWLNFISTELHKGMAPLFNPKTPAEFRSMALEKLKSRLAWVDGELAGKQYLMGENFSVADPYLFTVTNWLDNLKVDISGLGNLQAFRARMKQRPSVQAALEMEKKSRSSS